MLETVGLTPTEASRRVKNYSLGMRQRLGIATALTGNPEVLILDEPANGLDPAGIRWMRDLLRGFADQGGTVLLSSHLLHEIEVIADDLVVIGQGRIVAQGTKTELLAAAGTLVRASSATDWPGAHRVGRHRHQLRPDLLCASTSTPTSSARSRSPPVALTELRTADGAGLEEMFLELTAETAREGVRSMSATLSVSTEAAPTSYRPARPAREVPARIPFTRVLQVELIKMFDTRSGFWLMVGIAASALIATGAVIAFAPDDQITYDNFGAAIGVPMVFLLPVMAILSVTSEWSQRSGLTTFTLVPNRSRVLAAKAIVAMAVGAVSISVALAIGALGNLIGAGIVGVDPVSDITLLPGTHADVRQRAEPDDRLHARRADPQLAAARSWATSSTVRDPTADHAAGNDLNTGGPTRRSGSTSTGPRVRCTTAIRTLPLGRPGGPRQPLAPLPLAGRLFLVWRSEVSSAAWAASRHTQMVVPRFLGRPFRCSTLDGPVAPRLRLPRRLDVAVGGGPAPAVRGEVRPIPPR